MLTKNFKLAEFTASSTADRLKIDNSLSNENYFHNKIISNLRILCQEVLQPTRDAFNSPIIITSGYRSKELNEAVGGVWNSDHLYGYAADITSSDIFRLYKIVISFPHHQIYLNTRSRFIHVSYRKDKHNSHSHWVK